MSAVLKVENLNVTLTYRKASKKLVEDVSFEVHPGECLGILGESGSGKSMTVKSIVSYRITCNNGNQRTLINP